MYLQLIRTNFTSGYTEGHLYIEDENRLASGSKPELGEGLAADAETALCEDIESGAVRYDGTRVWNYYCDTLERDYDPVLSHVAGRCKCIEPTLPGHPYEVVTAWSPGFKRLMPYLREVPGRSGVMIHPGNNPSDSTGCILVGTRTVAGFVARSRIAFDPLYQRIADAYKRGEGVWLEVVNHS